jgi:hypothetical protein
MTSAKFAGAEIADAKNAPANVIPPKIADKVYGSGSSYGYSFSSDYIPIAIVSEVASLSSLPSGEEKPENQKPAAKPILPVPSINPVPPPSLPPVSATQKKMKAAMDGTPWPDDFNTWTNLARCEWIDAHAAIVSVEPPATTPAKLRSLCTTHDFAV